MIRQNMNVFQLNIDVGDGRMLGYTSGSVPIARTPLPILLPTRTGVPVLVGHAYSAWVGEGDRLWIDAELSDGVARSFEQGTLVWGVDTDGGQWRAIYGTSTEVVEGWTLIGLSVLPRQLS